MAGPPNSATDQAYGAAEVFLARLASLARISRESAVATWVSAIEADRGRPAAPHTSPQTWKNLGFLFGEAFIAWIDLTYFVTPAVRSKARLVYKPGQSPLRIGGEVAATVIEYLADDLGVSFRNSVYSGRRHPLEPDIAQLINDAQPRATKRPKTRAVTGWREDFEAKMKAETRAVVRQRLGIKNALDGVMIMAREWERLAVANANAAVMTWSFDRIDFGELVVLLKYEAERVIADERRQSEGEKTGQSELGSTTPVHKPDGWTKAELVAQAKDRLGSFGNSTFDKIRIHAGVPAAAQGGAGPHRRFSISQLRKLIGAARVVPLRRGEEIARAWEELLGGAA